MAVKATQEMIVSNKYKNPFIGLRPFTPDEQHLFFGREEHIEPVTQKLMKFRFVAVTGPSGIGKSSFISCGVIPGLMNHGNWNLIQVLPGKDALNQLLKKVQALPGNNTEEVIPSETEARKEAIIANLKNSNKKSKSNTILFIDQFEQLILNSRNNVISEKDTRTYLSMLMDLINQKELPVFVVIAIRSDYLGEFSFYHELAELINKSGYLLPSMENEDLRKSIEGPLKVTGADWDQRLVERIINDLKDHQDQLPILQHVLMRSFEAWRDPDLARKPLSIFAYENAGGAANAISQHADRAYNELDDNLKRVCEKIFKTIAKRTPDNKEIRQPATVSEIAAIGQVEADKIIKVVGIFNKKDYAFLTPEHKTELNIDSVINLSHEALIRNWKRLSDWVNEEAEAVKMYLRLADAAAKFQLGKTNLWTPPELELAMAWKEKNNPNLAWARRYNPAYERTMVFLDLSENEYFQDQENKTRNDRIRLRRSRIISIVSSVAAIVLLVFYLNRKPSGTDSSNEYIPIESGNTLAQNTDQRSMDPGMNDSNRSTDDENLAGPVDSEQADNNIQQPANDFRQSRNNEPEISSNQNTTSRASLSGNTSSEEANRNNRTTSRTNIQEQTVSERSSNLPVNTPTTTNAGENVSRQQTTTERQPAAEPEITISKEKIKSITESLAERSIAETSDPELKTLLAYQAQKFNVEYNNNAFDPEIYSALYASMKANLGKDYNAYKGHTNAIRTIDFMPNSSTFFSAGSDGKVLRWNLSSDKKESTAILSGRGIIEKLKVTNDGSWMLIGESRNGIFLVDLKNPGKNPTSFKADDPNVRAIALAPDNNTFYTAGLQNFIEKHTISGRTSNKIIETSSRINSLAVTPRGDALAGGTRDGKTIIWNTSGDYEPNLVYNDPDNAVQSVSYSPNGRYLACGTLNGKILLFRTDNYEMIRVISGHTARVTEIDFTPDSKYLASSAYDGKVLYWSMSNLGAEPVVLDDNGGFVFTVKFSNDGRYMVSGSAQENRLVARPVTSTQLADRICFLVSRNLTQSEWKRFVASDIPYQRTCTDK